MSEKAKHPIGTYFTTDEGGILYQDSYGAGLVYEPCNWRPGELDILCRLLNERGELDWDELEPLIDAELTGAQS